MELHAAVARWLCVAALVTQPKAGVDFRQYRTVKLVVTDSVNTSYSKEALPMLEGLLKGKLESLGYQVVAADPQMTLAVNVTDFSLGDRATRMLVGFGAGRAALKYRACFKDPSGNVLTEMEGGKSYTGMEFADNATYKSDESMRMGMISYSVSQIGQFMQNNGKL